MRIEAQLRVVGGNTGQEYRVYSDQISKLATLVSSVPHFSVTLVTSVQQGATSSHLETRVCPNEI